MFGPMGVAGGTMAITRDERVDRIGENSPPDSEKPNVVNRALRASGGNPPPAQPSWIRPLADFDRRERREYQVSRYG
jgi:hypothetical protein